LVNAVRSGAAAVDTDMNPDLITPIEYESH
jgi:hypothetical protein